MAETHKIYCQIGVSAHRRVVLGFAQANLLASLSFADILNEDTGLGYQRKFNARHSQDFRKYIQRAESCTIPLTFNLRPRSDGGWTLEDLGGGRAVLEIRPEAGKVFVQVDCQHRLGYLNDVDVTLPFMSFIGLSVKEEMEIFSVINSKAKGLSNSLLDFHDASLAADLARDRPELFIALHLSSNSESPWHKQLDLGGTATSGMMRRASLRTMQKAVKRFLTQTKLGRAGSIEAAAEVVIGFWGAVANLLQEEWNSPRQYLINKGIGVYALMTIAADIYGESHGQVCDKKFFTAKLSEFITEIDWSRNGPMKGLGGEGGVKAAVSLIRQIRAKHGLKVVANG